MRRTRLAAALLLVVTASLARAPAHGEGGVPPSWAADAFQEPTTVAEGRWPLDPQPAVVAGFDPPADPWGAGHRGVDLAGRPGQVVRAALAGRVAFAGTVAGKPVVTIDHGPTRTTYEPVVATVTTGDAVVAGAPIGRLAVLYGHCVPAACLHWGLRRGEVYLDPLTLVGGGPVRLLPLWRDDAAPVAPGASPRWVVGRGAVDRRLPPIARWRPPLDTLP